MKSFLKTWLLISMVLLSILTSCGEIEIVWSTPANQNGASNQPDSESEEPSEPSEPEPPSSVGEFRGLTSQVLYGLREDAPIPFLTNNNIWYDLLSGHVVSVDETGEAELKFGACSEPAFLRLIEGSRLELSSCSGEEVGTTLCLSQGLAVFDGACSEAYEILETPSARLLAKGTSFQVSYLPESMITKVVVDDGVVEVIPIDANGVLSSVTLRVEPNFFVFTTPLAEFSTLNGIDIQTISAVGNLINLNTALAPIVEKDPALQTVTLNKWETRSIEVKLAEFAEPIIRQGGGDTLQTIYERGVLTCGLSMTPGFTAMQPDGSIDGFDVDLCRALAAGVFGDSSAFELIPLTAADRFSSMLSGEVDIFMSAATIRFDREDFGITYVTFHNGQGIMVHEGSGINTLRDLNGQTICVTEGSNEITLEKAFRDLGIEIDSLVFQASEDAYLAYESGRCSAYSGSRTILGMFRSISAQPEAHLILNESLSIDPYGPVTPVTDQNWAEVLRWTVLCTINAEALGINQINVDGYLGSSDPNVSTLLGDSGDLGRSLGLPADFCYQIIKQVGNYEEIYNQHLGPGTLLGIPRGQNNLYENGGLFYPQFTFRIGD